MDVVGTGEAEGAITWEMAHPPEESPIAEDLGLLPESPILRFTGTHGRDYDGVSVPWPRPFTGTPLPLEPWAFLLGRPPALTPPPGSLAWSGGSHIINGEDCIPHSQPWQAALFKEDEFFCSGVLVHPQWVLSAAHCLQK
ncbi:Hypothetical predicted protein [Marmota monax]|uniref:Peptidase S1 domain-containing protein n=1 Tax=Marmota monax TaxID=9995 RepID=A0A5E4BYZ6_MARMO|nr:hypothetical protein GHT09_014660 [Marmota monax]VTJ73892.1 Hypothetical predicted protein [Marmota monax]